MNEKYKMMFFDAEGGEGGGGEGAGEAGSKGLSVFDAPTITGPAKSTTGSQEPPSGGEGSGTDGAGTGAGEGGEGAEGGKGTETPAAATTFDPEKFAKTFAETIGEHIKPAAPAVPPMSKEEAQKLLKVWTPTKEWVTKFDNLETREAALAEMRDGLVVQADTLAQMRMQELSDKLMERIGPKLDAVTRYENDQRDARFNKDYPQLANPKLQPLIRAVADDLVKQGKRFTSEGEAFKALAGGVEAVIKVSNPEFKLTTGSSPADNNNGREGNSIPVTTPGSRGTVGAAGRSNQPAKSRGLAIFDK